MSRPLTQRTDQQKKQTTGKSDEINKVDTKEMSLITPHTEATFGETIFSDNQTDSFILFASIQSKSQLSQARAVIAEMTARLSRLRSRYKRTLQQLEETIKVAEQELFEAGARIAPISRIPAEVLGLVFEIHVWEHNESPWVLARVSRLWRASVLMNGTLWGRIILTTSNWKRHQQGGLPFRFYNGMEICTRDDQLSRALTRAGATPLDLKIMFPPDDQQASWRREAGYEEKFCQLISLILEQQANPRLRSLAILADRWALLPGQLGKLSLSKLTSLTLDQPYPELIENVVAEVQRLQDLHVRAVSLRKMRTCKWWERLGELSITDFCPEEESDSVESALCDAKSLTSLVLKVDLDSHPDWHDGFLELTLPAIKSLKLLDLNVLWPVNCPNLTYFELYRPSNQYVAERSIHLPHLLEMKVTCFSSYVSLNAFDTPSLYTLNLHTWTGRKGAASFLEEILWPLSSNNKTAKGINSNIEPRSLLLEDTKIDQGILADVLMERICLEEFSTIKVEINEIFFSNLMFWMWKEKQIKMEQGAEPINGACCSTLKRMKLDLSGHKLKQEREKIERSALEWLDARSEAGVPMERLAILYSKGEEWRELIEDGF